MGIRSIQLLPLKKSSLLLAGSMTLNLVLGALFIYKYLSSILYKQHISHGLSKVQYAFSRDKLYEQLPNDPDEIIFIGSSLTSQFIVEEYFRNRNVKNRGINGDNSRGLLLRLDEVLESEPLKIFVEIGINDLRRNIDKDTVVSNYRQIVGQIKTKSPRTIIYLQGILPVTETYDKMYGGHVNDQVFYVNEKIKELSNGKDIIYLDIAPLFYNESEALKEEYSIDGLHLSADAYNKLRDIISPYIN
jgi:lysophospholipase L1-like esterase